MEKKDKEVGKKNQTYYMDEDIPQLLQKRVKKLRTKGDSYVSSNSLANSILKSELTRTDD